MPRVPQAVRAPVFRHDDHRLPACGSTDLDKSDGTRHMPSTGEKLEHERRALLDLSLRWNPPIGYRPLRTSGLTIVDELPSEVFRILVTEERRMSFLPNPDAVSDQDDDGELDTWIPNSRRSIRQHACRSVCYAPSR